MNVSFCLEDTKGFLYSCVSYISRCLTSDVKPLREAEVKSVTWPDWFVRERTLMPVAAPTRTVINRARDFLPRTSWNNIYIIP